MQGVNPPRTDPPKKEVKDGLKKEREHRGKEDVGPQSRPGIRAVKLVVCPYWGSRVRVWVSPRGQLSWTMSGFFGFSQGSPFPPFSPHQHFPIFNPHFVSFHILINNFMSSFTSFMVRKKVGLVQHGCIIITRATPL